jgi:hypothetical protein
LILLSEDGGKTTVDIKCWDDLYDRPAFKTELNPHDIELKEIIGKYILSEAHPCGLSSCRSPHQKGYLVVAEGGTETNIGHLCGKKIFGVDWTTLEKQFTKQLNENRYRENLESLQKQIDRHAGRINRIVRGDAGAVRLQANIARLLGTGFREEISVKLKRRAKNNDYTVTDTVLLSNEEREIASATGAGSSTREEIIFRINGLSAISGNKNSGVLYKPRWEMSLRYFRSCRQMNWIINI